MISRDEIQQEPIKTVKVMVGRLRCISVLVTRFVGVCAALSSNLTCFGLTKSNRTDASIHTSFADASFLPSLREPMCCHCAPTRSRLQVFDSGPVQDRSTEQALVIAWNWASTPSVLLFSQSQSCNIHQAPSEFSKREQQSNRSAPM